MGLFQVYGTVAICLSAILYANDRNKYDTNQERKSKILQSVIAGSVWPVCILGK